MPCGFPYKPYIVICKAVYRRTGQESQMDLAFIALYMPKGEGRPRLALVTYFKQFCCLSSRPLCIQTTHQTKVCNKTSHTLLCESVVILDQRKQSTKKNRAENSYHQNVVSCFRFSNFFYVFLTMTINNIETFQLKIKPR